MALANRLAGPVDVTGTRARSIGSEARAAVRANAPFVVLAALYVAVGLGVLGRVDQSVPFGFDATYRTPAVLAVTYLFVTALVAVVKDVLLGSGRPGDADTWRALYERWFGTRRLVGTLLVLAFLPPLMNVMLGFRLALTEFHPFAFDPAFMRVDAWLHFGRQPWEWLHPLLGSIPATVAIDRAYVYGWFSLLWTGVVWQAVHGREPQRLQFFLAFGASWILLGTVAATLLSSAGPAFYGRVTGLPDPYTPLMTFLQGIDGRVTLHAVENQARLWASYRTWGGISAMPSMHLAIATVVTLTSIQSNRHLAWVVGPVWLLMLVGSVHLGWHYAIDSYAGIVAATGIWFAAGLVARWWLGTPAEERAP